MAVVEYHPGMLNALPRSHAWSTIITLGLLVLTFTSCGGDNSKNDSQDPPVFARGATSATGTVTAEGGTMRLEDGSAIVVPPGAVAAPVELTLSAANGIPAGAPAGPDGRLPVGAVLSTIPHGQTFLKPVELRVALPAGTAAAAVRLFTQAGNGGAWTPVQGVKVNGKLASVATTHFSHWGWFAEVGSDEDLPTTGPAYIQTTAVLDLPGGAAYYSFTKKRDVGRYQIHRTALTPGAPFNALYTGAPGDQLEVIAAGPEGVFFYRAKARKIARMKQDGTDLQLDWTTMPLAAQDSGFDPERGNIGQGMTTPTHLFVARFAIPLSTGVPVETEFALDTLSPDRTRAAYSGCSPKAGCSGKEINLSTGAISDVLGSWGQVATDGTSWYFGSYLLQDVNEVTMAAYGAMTAKVIFRLTGRASSLAIAGNKLFRVEHPTERGAMYTIVAYDQASGARVGSFQQHGFNGELLKAYGNTLYYDVFGELKMMPLSEVK